MHDYFPDFIMDHSAKYNSSANNNSNNNKSYFYAVVWKVLHFSAIPEGDPGFIFGAQFGKKKNIFVIFFVFYWVKFSIIKEFRIILLLIMFY